MVKTFSSVLEQDKAERLATGFTFTEGPLWHPDGFYYFVDIRASRLYRLVPGREPEVVLENTNEGNGITFDLQGRLIMCESGNRRVVRIHTDKRIEVLAERYEGMRFHRPNDIICKSNGSIYFTDYSVRVPLNQREIPYDGVYRIMSNSTI